MDDKQSSELDFIFRPVVGTALAVLAGLSFFFLCMILPFVGPAGSRVPHAGQNKVAFLFVLLVTFAFAALSGWSKLGRRKVDDSPLPIFSLGLCMVCILTFVILLFDGFAI